MEWVFLGTLITGLISGISAGVTASKNAKELAINEEANRLEAYSTSLGELNNTLAEIQNALTEYQKLDATNETNQSVIDTNNEWLSNYQKMLNGDRTDTVLGRELWGLETTKSQLESKGELLEGQMSLYEKQKSLYERQAATYLLSSAVEKQNAYDTALNEYSQMLKEKSLLNVAASGSGQLEGSYSAAQFIQNQKIRNFVGVDMTFDTGSDWMGADDGSFLMSYTALRKQISDNIEANNLQILMSQQNIAESENAISANKDAITEAEGNIKNFFEENETTFHEKTVAIEDAQKAIEENMKTLEIWKAKVKTEQTNALTALMSALNNKGSDADVGQIYSYAEQLDKVNSVIKEGISVDAGYDATDDIDVWKKTEEERIKKEEAARIAAEEAAKNAQYDNDDGEEAKIQEGWDKAEAELKETLEKEAAEELKWRRLTEQVKNSDEYKESQAEKNNAAANEKGKSQTEYYKQQQEKQKEAEIQKEVQKDLSTNSAREEKFNTKKNNRVTK